MANRTGSSSRPSFNFFLSCDINLQVKVRISHLQGLPVNQDQFYQEGVTSLPHTALHVVAALTSGGDPLTLEVQTTYVNCSSSSCQWGELLTFCIKYRDLPHDALLCLTVVEVAEGRPPAVAGGTTLPLFNKKGRLKTGPQRLRVWPGREPSMSWPSSTPGKVPLAEQGRVPRLEHLVRLYNRGDMPRVDWLDPLTMAEIRNLQQQIQGSQAGPYGCRAGATAAAAVPLELLIDLPTFPHAVLYYQPVSYTAAALQAVVQQGAAPAVAAAGRRGEAEKGAATSMAQGEGSIVLMDPEVGRDNPAELKAQKLARSLTRGIIDRDLKPNSDERRRITAVLKLPPNKPLHADERALLWRFRYSLTQETRALTKFLKCVDWSDALEAKQAADLMREWATIDIADALELLSPDFRNPEVRAHAVSVLRQKDDDELLYYLLQLVQALRYELSDRSPSAEFLVERAKANPQCAVMLHWYLYTELDDAAFGPRASATYSLLVSALQTDPSCSLIWEGIRRQQDMRGQLAWLTKELKASKVRAARATQRLHEVISESGPLSELLTLRVPLPLNPAILLTGLVPAECMCFKSAQLPLRLSFTVDPCPVQWRPPQNQAQRVMLRSHTLTSPSSPSRQRQEAAADAQQCQGPSPLPPGQTSAHLSALTSSSHSHGHLHGPAAPAHLTPAQVLQTLPGRTGIVVQGDQVRCVMIYKKGDDLRQDQFILQMISLMDRLLKRENLDLRMTPYKVLPTSSDDGLVEFVPSTPLSKVLSEHRTIHKYLAQWQADPSGPFGLKPEALETFVRSCAGYCVATYVLGVGDRHLDNLMLTSDARLFHIDFGYILGNDPKPFPPPMKICKEMVEAMGGQGSEYYVQFRMYACEAYNILRKSADLILSLFHLMAGASIETIRQDPEKAILKLQEKFRLDFNDEQAVEYMQQLINESATALMPQIVETTHRWAQYWR